MHNSYVLLDLKKSRDKYLGGCVHAACESCALFLRFPYFELLGMRGWRALELIFLDSE